jgi:selenocysteine-specific elongation factor
VGFGLRLSGFLNNQLFGRSDMRRLILGTAGHIDHGKTALIGALTGIDTDRLQEEKARGISIDLGFAHLDLPGGVSLGIVDVPGHERFIRNMLAGVGGIDLVLFVVACDESIMPQTQEHFDIVSLLGVEHAVFALTKSDLVDEDMIDIVRDDVTGLIEDTPFEGSPIVATSTKTGSGLDEVRKALEQVAAGIEERTLGEVARLPIDRVFTMTGRGTVVTGTLWSGAVSTEDRLRLLPADKEVRVRSIEVHGQHVDRALAGRRTALGLHGIEKQVIERGDCVVSAGDFAATTMIDSEVHMLPAAARRVKAATRMRFHLGASEVMGRVYMLGAETLGPGEHCFAQIRFEAPVVAAFGDRFVIRTYSPMRTVGGGRVLDPVASKHRRRDPGVPEWLGVLGSEDLMRIVEGYIKRSPSGMRLDLLRLKLNRGKRHIRNLVQELESEDRVFEPSTGLFIHADTLDALGSKIDDILVSYQTSNRLVWGMPREELRERLGSIDMAFFGWILDRLQAEGRVFTKKGSVRAGSGDVELTPDEVKLRSIIIDSLKAKPFQPPSEREIQSHSDVAPETARRVVNLLIEDGEVVRLGPGLIVHTSAVETAASKVAAYLRQHGEATASDLKNLLGTSRKYAVPMLEHLDRLGVTRRSGNKRTLP